MSDQRITPAIVIFLSCVGIVLSLAKIPNDTLPASINLIILVLYSILYVLGLVKLSDIYIEIGKSERLAKTRSMCCRFNLDLDKFAVLNDMLDFYISVCG
jgi:hypothetical protein